MRLCFVTTFYPPYHFGGDAIFVYRLAHLLAERGHDVDVFHNPDAYHALGGGEPRSGFVDHPRVHAHGLRSRFPLVNLLGLQQTGLATGPQRRMQEAIVDGSYDAVHFHNVSLMGAPGVLGARPNNGAPTLMTIHEHWLVCPMHVLWRYDQVACDEPKCLRCQLRGKRPPQWWRYGALRDRAVEALDLLLAPSRFTQLKHRNYGMRRETRLLPHFVPDPGPPTAASKNPERPYFLFVGRLEHIKGAHTLLDVFRRLPNAELWIAGDGNERKSLEHQARGLTNVRFLGSLPPAELPTLYSGAVAALVPSVCYEVFGLIAVEALASATPIVVRNRGPLPEIVEQSGAGFTYDDESELLRILEALLAKPEATLALKEKARSAYLEHWTPDIHLDRYLEALASAAPARAS